MEKIVLFSVQNLSRCSIGGHSTTTWTKILPNFDPFRVNKHEHFTYYRCQISDSVKMDCPLSSMASDAGTKFSNHLICSNNFTMTLANVFMVKSTLIFEFYSSRFSNTCGRSSWFKVLKEPIKIAHVRP